MKPPTMHGFVSLFALAALAPWAAAQIPQPEAMVMAFEGPGNQTLNFGEYTVGASVDDPTDVDGYEFLAATGDQVLITARTATIGLDLRVVIYDPGGVQVDASLCDGSLGPCTVRLPLTLTSGGTWRFEISDNGADEAGDYVVQLERLPPFAAGAVPTLPWSVTVQDRIQGPTDSDFFAFESRFGDLLEITVTSTTPGFDPQLDFYDPNGANFGTAFCSGGAVGNPNTCSFTRQMAGTLDGIYFVRISDAGTDEAGSYTLTLNCDRRGSGCPTDAGILALTVDQPAGPGSLRIENQGGISDAVYVTTFSRLNANDTMPGYGWWGGLHLDLSSLFEQALAGPPFAGVLNLNGTSQFQVPAGSLPPQSQGLRLHWVTRTLGPSFASITETSNIVSITLQ